MRINFSPKQLLFHQHCAKRQNLATGKFDYDCSHTLYGGAAGGGKTYAIGASAIMSSIEEPGSVISITRQYLDDLLRTTQEVFLQFVCSPGSEAWQELGIEFNKNKGVMTLRNTATENIPPSSIHWLGFKSAGGGDTGAINRLLSTQWSRMFVDESHEVAQKIIQILPTRCRLKRPNMDYKLGIKYASNPAPNWLRDMFVILGKNSTVPYSKAPGRLFIPAFISDNQDNLPANYRSSFDLLPESLKRRFLEGDWNAFEGQVWPGGITPLHLSPLVDVEALTKRSDWVFIQAVDPGLKDPTASVWAAYNTDLDLLLFFGEYEEKFGTVGDHAAQFREMEENWGLNPDEVIRIIDPDAAKETLATAHTGHTVKSLFSDEGFHFLTAQNDTASKTLTMGKRLKVDKERPHPVYPELEGCPGVLFSSTEMEIIDPTYSTRMSILNTIWDQETFKEKWKNENKHLVDCATYITNYVETKLSGGKSIRFDPYGLGRFRRYGNIDKKTAFYGR